MRKDEMISMLATAKLTSLQTQCLAWYYFDFVGQQAIAERLSITQPRVSQHIRAGLKKLERIGLALRPFMVEQTEAVPVMTGINLDKLGPDEIKAVW